MGNYIVPTPFFASFGPFTGGLNNARDPYLLEGAQAQAATSIDNRDGTLRGLWPISDPVGTGVASSSKWFYRLPSGDWIYSDVRQYAVTTGTKTYRTKIGSDGVPALPKVILEGTTESSMGVEEPVGSWFAVTPHNLGSGDQIQARWAVTYVTSDGQESNPNFLLTSDGEKVWTFRKGYRIQVSIGTPTSSRVTAWRIYRTEMNDPDGTLYFIAEHPVGTSAQFGEVTSDELDFTRPCNWDVGGNPSLIDLPTDHGLPYAFTVMADSLHSTTNGAGSAGSGILFAARYNTVYWSALGSPDYWPQANYLGLPDDVEALVTSNAQTLAFTATGIYAFSGVDDATMTAARASRGVTLKHGCGATVRQTPYGVFFLSKEGLALFDGTGTEVISRGILSEDYLAALVNPHAIYHGHTYYLFHSTGTLLFDLRTWPQLKVIETPYIVQAAHATSSNLYLLLEGDAGQLRTWDLTAAPEPVPPPPPLASIGMTMPSDLSGPTTVTITAYDASNRVITGYQGTVALSYTVNNGGAGLTFFHVNGADYTGPLQFVNGVCTFLMLFGANYVGYFYLTATSTEKPELTVSKSAFFH